MSEPMTEAELAELRKRYWVACNRYEEGLTDMLESVAGKIPRLLDMIEGLQQLSRDELHRRRTAAHTLIEVIGARGSETVEEVAIRAAAEIRRLRGESPSTADLTGELEWAGKLADGRNLYAVRSTAREKNGEESDG